MDRGFYEEARTQFTRIKTEFAQSPLQVQAVLKIADSYFEEESYNAAATAYQEFIRTFPGQPEVPDALFRLGLSYAKQMPSTPQRDARATGQTLDTFTRLLAEYPNYAKKDEAQQWIERAENQLADKIFGIARFYEKKELYDSAARRYGELVQFYSHLPQAEEALARQIRCLKLSKDNSKAEELTSFFTERYSDSKYRDLLEP